ncbi:NAD(P)-binding protein [Xylaria venustula]|nr:NAD(P)-binding protein [Xylaria venustula]
MSSSTKSILITGCSASGIGAAVGITLARHGHYIFATARNTAEIPETLSRLENTSTSSLPNAFMKLTSGSLRTTQAFADLLVASRGRIINVSSSPSIMNSPWVSAYATSKAALNTLSETLRLELELFGVSVVTILPGVIDSNLHVNNAAGFDVPRTSRYQPSRTLSRTGPTGRRYQNTTFRLKVWRVNHARHHRH